MDQIGTSTYIARTVCTAKEYLERAAVPVELNLNRNPFLVIRGDRIELVCEEHHVDLHPDASPRRFDQVYHLYREWRKKALNVQLRGFQAMAEASRSCDVSRV